MYYSSIKEMQRNFTEKKFVCKRWRCMHNAHLNLHVKQRITNLCYFSDMKRKKKIVSTVTRSLNSVLILI
jgi:hypothetical protein